MGTCSQSVAQRSLHVNSLKDEGDQPRAGTLPPLHHDHQHNNDHHHHAEPRRTIGDGALHGLQDVVLAGVAPVGWRTRTGSFSVDYHAAAVVAAAPPAAFCSVQVQPPSAAVKGGARARAFRAHRDGGGWRRGAEGARSEAGACRQLLHGDA